MHHALPVNHHIHLLQRYPVQPHGLDDLQSLVHKGCAVDGDFCSHFPVGMLQGIRFGNGMELFPGHAEEGASGAGENQPLDFFFVVAAHEALKNGRVLGIHGNNFRVILFRLRHDQLSGADQGLLIGKADALARPDGGKGRLQPYHAHHGGDDAVRFRQRGRFQQTLLPPVYPDGKVFNPGLQLFCCFLRSHDRKGRPESAALLGHSLHTGSRGKRRHPQSGQAADNIQALPSDGAGGAENTDTFDHIRLLTSSPEAEAAAVPP